MAINGTLGSNINKDLRTATQFRLYLTRQAAEPPLFPGSLLYVLYVLYTLYALQNVVYVLYKAYLVHVEMLCV